MKNVQFLLKSYGSGIEKIPIDRWFFLHVAQTCTTNIDEVIKVSLTSLWPVLMTSWGEKWKCAIFEYFLCSIVIKNPHATGIFSTSCNWISDKYWWSYKTKSEVLMTSSYDQLKCKYENNFKTYLQNAILIYMMWGFFLSVVQNFMTCFDEVITLCKKLMFGHIA